MRITTMLGPHALFATGFSAQGSKVAETWRCCTHVVETADEVTQIRELHYGTTLWVC